ncbi:MAG TPA: acyl-CoA dehydrogenase family protein [Burkholderiales bacterium]|nr:acyl-CoA dehydrogenase family protein [Burkholderiales bacterium]
MDFSLTPDQQMFRDSVAAFARRELSEGALERAHAAQFPHDIARKMSDAGLMGITLPEADGGGGGTLMDAVIAIEEIARFCPRSADVIQEGNFGAIRVLAHFATEDQKKRYLAPLLRGEEVIAVGMTEPDAGSATTDLKTTATPDGAGFRINGSKVFPNPHADQYLVYVRYGPGVEGIGSVMLRRSAPGFSIGKVSKFMSGNEWAPIFFDNVYVPPEDVLLPAGGFKKQIQGFNAERIGNAARSLAYGRYCFDLARQYALERKQFGRPLCEFQGLQWKFADMKVKLDAAQLLLYRAATNADRGFPAADETTIAKLMCNQAGFDIANESMQVMGGLGYTQDTLVDYCLRRSRGWMIAGGSIEMMKNRLAEIIFERRFSQRPPRPSKQETHA